MLGYHIQELTATEVFNSDAHHWFLVPGVIIYNVIMQCHSVPGSKSNL